MVVKVEEKKHPSPLDIPDSLWKKYSTRAPRYTSYPTAPCFRRDPDTAAFEGAYRAFAAGPMSLYLHIPYCQQRCLYCGCHLFVKRDRSAGGAYVDRLLREAELLREMTGEDHQVLQFALGGGTPNFLLPRDMTRLVRGLAGVWGFPAQGERSIELDSRTVDTEYLDTLLELGFNRFSLGVQDLDTAVMDRLGRKQTRDTVENIIEHLRSRKARAVNFDLMYGLPGQTPESFGKTVDQVIAMRPSRIALFGYAHVPWLKPHQKALEGFGVPGDRERVALWGCAFEKFRDAGYVPIGMDHFAEAKDELRHAQAAGKLHRNFMGYTTQRGLDQLGLGVSSISAVGAVYAQNDKELKAYRESVDAGRVPWQRGLVLSREDRMRRELIIDLFCNFFLDIPAFEENHRIDFRKSFETEWEALSGFAQDDLLIRDAKKIQITPVGRFFIRNICMVFDQYLEPNRKRYSKTV